MMRFGHETGSFVNSLMSQGVSKDPQIGDGATILGWTDRHAATVVFYDDKKKIVGVQRDNVVRVDKNGMSESQDYEFSRNTEATVKHFKKTKSGKWLSVYLNKATNRWNSVPGGNRLIVGVRKEYHDFSF